VTFAPQVRAKVRRVGAFLLRDRFYQGMGKGAAVDTAPNPHQGEHRTGSAGEMRFKHTGE